jgi:hypothetical protein
VNLPDQSTAALTAFDNMGRAFDRRCRISRNDLAAWQVILDPTKAVL